MASPGDPASVSAALQQRISAYWMPRFRWA